MSRCATTVRGSHPDDLPRVFDRFYRAHDARARLPGSGLGLAIVAQTVDRYGGSVFAQNRDDGPGASVGFTLPPAHSA